MTYNGQCACGKVQFTLQSDPMFAQYCHCGKCRDVMSTSKRESDLQGFAYTIGCQTKDICFTKGQEFLIPKPRNNAILYHCNSCDSQIYGVAKDERHRDMAGMNANNFEECKALPKSFKPIRHVYYVDRSFFEFDLDALPKFVDMPVELGGSGDEFIIEEKAKPSLKAL